MVLVESVKAGHRIELNDGEFIKFGSICKRYASFYVKDIYGEINLYKARESCRRPMLKITEDRYISVVDLDDYSAKAIVCSTSSDPLVKLCRFLYRLKGLYKIVVQNVCTR